MATASPLPPAPPRVRVVDDREAVEAIARRAEELVAKGLQGKEFLRAFGLDDEDDEPSITVRTVEELDTLFASDDGCASSS
jgi:hypothetical protein